MTKAQTNMMKLLRLLWMWINVTG